jgi:cell division protein FtsA
MQMAADERPLAVVSQGFSVDDTPGVMDPLGMAAKCLYGRYHVVTFSEQSARNVRRCCERLELVVDGVHVEPLVSAEAVLDDDERELGVLVLDIGAGTTSVAAYRDGMLLHTGVINLGGAHLTTDLAHGLKTPQGEGERLLESAGCVDETLIGPNETFDIPGLGGRPARTLPRAAIVEVLQPRAEEILFAAIRDLEHADVLPEDLAGGVVLTGGVASLQGLTELAAEVMGLPARLGTPRGFGGLNKVLERPDFAAAAGVLRRAARGEGHIEASRRPNVFSRFTSRVREMTVDYL